MAKTDDPALYESNYIRQDKDRYWTAPWMTSALLNTVDVPDAIWEPAAGRGDIVGVLQDYGKDVVASDIDLSEFDTGLCDFFVGDFLESVPPDGVRGIITNPPYNVPRGIAKKFIEHALDLMSFSDIEFVAMLLRSEFCHGKTRRHMFGECTEYGGEIVLTTRPRWDWWFREEPEAGPRHNFSWFFWTREGNDPPHQLFHYKDRETK